MKRRDLLGLPFATLLRAAGGVTSRTTGDAPPPEAAVSGHVLARATVVGVEADGRPRVMLAGVGAEPRTAEWALPYRYVPRVGDQLRVVALGPRAYVIGVVAGRGHALLHLGRGAALRATGTLRLRGDRGVRVVAERITLRAQALELAVGRLEEKLGRALRHARRRLTERSGASRRVVEGADRRLARRLVVLGARRVRVDAEQLIVS